MWFSGGEGHREETGTVEMGVGTVETAEPLNPKPSICGRLQAMGKRGNSATSTPQTAATASQYLAKAKARAALAATVQTNAAPKGKSAG